MCFMLNIDLKVRAVTTLSPDVGAHTSPFGQHMINRSKHKQKYRFFLNKPRPDNRKLQSFVYLNFPERHVIHAARHKTPNGLLILL